MIKDSKLDRDSVREYARHVRMFDIGEDPKFSDYFRVSERRQEKLKPIIERTLSRAISRGMGISF